MPLTSFTCANIHFADPSWFTTIKTSSDSLIKFPTLDAIRFRRCDIHTRPVCVGPSFEIIIFPSFVPLSSAPRAGWWTLQVVYGHTHYLSPSLLFISLPFSAKPLENYLVAQHLASFFRNVYSPKSLAMVSGTLVQNMFFKLCVKAYREVSRLPFFSPR